MASEAASPPSPSEGPAAARWRALVRARAAQMDAAYAALGRTSADYWERRAGRFHARTRERGTSDPLFARLRAALRPSDTLLDVGAGAGRFSLPLAPLVREVIAVEPAPAMRERLAAEAAARGVTNLTVVPARWQDAPALAADVVLCAHVLYPLPDAAPFLRRLDAATRRECYVYLRERHPDEWSSPAWERWHGEPRRLGPAGGDALAVLHELGIPAEVEWVDNTSNWQYADLDEAEASYLDDLILPDEPAVRRELRAWLAAWLVPRAGGLAAPIDRLPAGIIRWRRQ
jgi:SAM-dependent methyltransferase